MRQHKLHLTHCGTQLTQCVSTWLFTLQRKDRKEKREFYEMANADREESYGEKKKSVNLIFTVEPWIARILVCKCFASRA